MSAASLRGAIAVRAALAALVLAASVAAPATLAQKVPEGAPKIRMEPLGIVNAHPLGSIFRECSGVAYDPSRDEFVVCDPKSNRISCYSPRGFPRFSVGEGAGLLEPRAVAIGADRGFYVAGAALGRVLRLNYRGEPIGELDVSESGDASPPAVIGLARVPDGGVAVLIDSPPRIRVFDSSMKERLRIQGGSEKDVLQEPTDLALDNRGFVYVTDHRGAAIQVYDDRGSLVESWGRVGEGVGPTDFTLPAGIAVDPEGRIFVLDTVRQDIRAYERGGRLIGLWGGFGRGAGAVGYPVDLALDLAGKTAVVSEKAGRRIQFFRIETGDEALQSGK